MKCTACNAETRDQLHPALSHGWRRVTVETQAGVKYGVYCPKETNARIQQDTGKWLERTDRASATPMTTATPPRTIPARR